MKNCLFKSTKIRQNVIVEIQLVEITDFIRVQKFQQINIVKIKTIFCKKKLMTFVVPYVSIVEF